jgi:membrane associated rhomboid family serine protease
MVLPLHDDNPTERPPIVTVGLIVLCVLVYIWQALSGPAGEERIAYSLGAIPAVLVGGRELPPELAVIPPTASIFTSMFLHGGFLHLLFNMLYLWIFGNNVEDAMGHVRFIVFYLVCGVVAVFAQALPDPDSTIPMVGASGAISGVLGAYMLLYPHARVLLGLPVGFFIVQLGRFPAGWVLASWFVLQLVSNQFASDGGGVAFRAHIGGFVAGVALIALFKRRDVQLWRPKR